MHLLAVFVVIGLAGIIRSQSNLSQGNWHERWHKALFLLMFPALLILSTAIAVLYMGCHGAMLGMKAGSWGCTISASMLVLALACLAKLAYQANQSIGQLATYKKNIIDGNPAKIIDTELFYSAQVGFWQPELVLSQGLLNAFDQPHIAAVLAHEQAHVYYRDTFWFFWLGWMRSFTAWLPKTQMIWQELLLLRELRADRKAAESVDFLLIAESLLTVAKHPLQLSPVACANLHDGIVGDRLNERINSLLEQSKTGSSNTWQQWGWICLVLLPLFTIPLHS